MNNIVKLELVNYVVTNNILFNSTPALSVVGNFVMIERSYLFLIVGNNCYDPYYLNSININMLYDFKLGSSSYL